MNTYMLPTNDDFIEEIAKSVAKERILSDLRETMGASPGISAEAKSTLENTFIEVFETIWAGITAQDKRQRDLYIADARAAVSAINLKLMFLD